MDPASLEAAIGERTRLVWLEAPGSVTMEFPDLVALVDIARRRGVTTALDNTWGAGIAFAPFAIGAERATARRATPSRSTSRCRRSPSTRRAVPTC